MDQETQRVLEMVQAGQITPEEAAKLLAALDAAAVQPPQSGRRRTLRINVTDTRSGRTKVDVNIPLSLVEVASKLGLSLGIKRAPELADVNFNDIMAAIKGGADGKIVDIEDDNDSQHVVVMVD
jgi:hypothetical protein